MIHLFGSPSGSIGSELTLRSTGRRAAWRLGARTAGLALVLLTVHCATSSAQINPADMRSGSLNVTTGTSQVDVFTVPSGQYFVLTDIEWSTSSSDGDLAIVTLNLYGGGTRWRYRGVYQHVSGVYRAPFGVQSHFETGIVFDPGVVVRFESASQISGRSYMLNWSGYLSPAGVSAAGESGSLILDGIEQNTPNPFNPETRIEYALAASGDVDLRVFDTTGRLVRTLAEGRREAGEHSVVWDGANEQGEPLPSGVYYYQLSTEQGRESRKAVMLR